MSLPIIQVRLETKQDNIYTRRLEIVNSGVCIDPIASYCLEPSSTEATTEPDTEVGTEAKHGSQHG